VYIRAAPGAVSRVGPGRRDQLLRTAVDGLGMCCCYCIPRFGSDGILVVSSLPAASLSLGCRGFAWKGQKVMKMVDGWPEVFGSPFGLLTIR